jgi:NAD-dependent deacetylase
MLTKVRSSGDPGLIYDIGYKEIKIGDTCEKGFQLRPHIVWFGEAVPAIEEAAEISGRADIFIVIGTSLIVYPAAGLLDYAPNDAPVFVIDPNTISSPYYRKIEFIKEKASIGIKILKEKLINEYL